MILDDLWHCIKRPSFSLDFIDVGKYRQRYIFNTTTNQQILVKTGPGSHCRTRPVRTLADNSRSVAYFCCSSSAARFLSCASCNCFSTPFAFSSASVWVLNICGGGGEGLQPANANTATATKLRQETEERII
ncbi:MAG: hypothetical protein ABI171_08180 [Collimonas sp.]|uniref:hypothetical protein n=1 Tax=Collimonas sp. TaxID=1963772 RepID=UPI0032674EFF